MYKINISTKQSFKGIVGRTQNERWAQNAITTRWVENDDDVLMIDDEALIKNREGFL